ncbi:hemin importer ATP-binding subunit [Vibrio ichthyoenteri ATCC 700023]|uniref:Hemin importer ATP-binding subunit n=1 Tax=Vibrio ichthyoenteri ATCC 700023 TaxID=870968 RepID=F9RZA7_9VIBR|nr:heme ABC transporter ATP-binding protein [Vibrio ichthyoenteri]EGU45509.1 hemin importer ATP-binding subunit [Vibrio ichthyoenteri ATCC 700023]
MLSLFSSKKSGKPPMIDDYYSSTTVAIEHLSVSLGGRTILDNVHLTLQRGQFTALLGPNGTGKSTLLKALTGEISARGEFALFGQARENWPSALLAKNFGVLPQSSSLSFNFMAREVVALGGLGLSMPREALDNVIDKNMQLTDVLHLSNRAYPTLSGGEKQRVHLARVLTQLEQSGGNKVLLLDEPTSALDIHHQHTTLALAQHLAQQGATVVAVLHDLNLAAQYADRIVILNQGVIVTDDTPEKALNSSVIEQVYQHKVSVISHPTLGHPVVIAA